MSPARAKRIIYLFMAGAPSQLDLFDHKPALKQLDGQPCPGGVHRRRALRVHQGHAASCSASPYQFARTAQCGAEISELLPHLAKIADDIAIVRSLHTTQFNHAPGQLFMHTGQPGARPAEHGLVADLRPRQREPGPARLRRAALRRQRAGRRQVLLGQRLPADASIRACSSAQGRPGAVLSQSRRASTARRGGVARRACSELNQARQPTSAIPRSPRASPPYEMAYRMQIERARADGHLSRSPRTIHELYGDAARARRRSPTTACSPAGWSSAACASCSSITAAGTLTAQRRRRHRRCSCRSCASEIDQRGRGADHDLKQRGLLDDTLVVWGGEFGRTPMNEARNGSKLSAATIIRTRSRCGWPAAA